MTDDPRLSGLARFPLGMMVMLAACATPTGPARPLASAPAAAPDEAAPTARQVEADAKQAIGPAASPRPSEAPPVAKCGAFAAAVRSAATHARTAAESGGRDLPAATAGLFSDLADAVAAQPPTNPARQKIIKELRFQAERLRRADRLSFGLARWIKEGLLAALDGLQTVAPADARASFWIGGARQAASRIDKDSGIAFQRARVQDAVRSTVDAFAAVGQVDDTCA